MRKERVIERKEGFNKDGKYVIYWMQQSQRVHFNHALAFAIDKANALNVPLVVYFGLTKNYPEANARHYTFMLEGLVHVKEWLIKLGISFIFELESPEEGLLKYLDDTTYLVMDQGYLYHQRLWRQNVLKYILNQDLKCGVSVVETDVIVPVTYVSNKAEYGAYTLRPKITKLYQTFRDFTTLPVLKNQQTIFDYSYDMSDIDRLVSFLPIDQKVKPSMIYKGGYIEASRRFSEFLLKQANDYVDSNDPSKDLTSKMSMYLHFGQISSLELLERLYVAHDQKLIDGPSFDGFIEQLMVRRELAFNFVYYQKGYDQFEYMTEPWAYQTMTLHENDFKPYVYDINTLENANTHDIYWNAAMIEMVDTGYMHNYMRMYWAKKIIEWSPSFEIAYQTIKLLNNKYFIDGRDPNSYAGIAWCFGKHDRAWTERTIFGKLRYMNDKGLERKFDINAYVLKWKRS